MSHGDLNVFSKIYIMLHIVYKLHYWCHYTFYITFLVYLSTYLMFIHVLLCAVTSHTEEEIIASCALYAAALPDLRQLK